MEHLAGRGNSGDTMVGIKAPYFDGTQPCLDADPEVFFPETPEEVYHSSKIAKEICGTCAFVELCLDYALSIDVAGIWAGTTKTDRKRLRKERKLPKPESIIKFNDALLK